MSSAVSVRSGPVPDEQWLNFPVAGHAVLTIDSTGAVTSCNEGARLLFAIDDGDIPICATDLFGPPVGAAGGVRALLDAFAASPDRPAAWTGNLVCFRGPGRPYVVTATAARELSGSPGSGGVNLVCGPPPARNAGVPAASWLPPDLARRIGHELRNSLTGIAGLAGVMARRAEAAITAGDQLRRLRMIEQNARTAIATVDRVVELTQLESGRVRCHRSQTDLQQILAAAIGLCAAIVRPDQRVRTEDIGDALLVHTDPTLVRQIVAELIANALIAGNAHQVRIRAVGRGDSVLVEVIDDGCGIEPGEHETIFDPFVHGDSACEGAVGLGLHLARRRAQLVGGTLSVLSSPGHGSAFTLVLPSATARPDSGPASPAMNGVE